MTTTPQTPIKRPRPPMARLIIDVFNREGDGKHKPIYIESSREAVLRIVTYLLESQHRDAVRGVMWRRLDIRVVQEGDHDWDDPIPCAGERY